MELTFPFQISKRTILYTYLNQRFQSLMLPFIKGLRVTYPPFFLKGGKGGFHGAMLLVALGER